MVIPRAEASPISPAYESPETWTEIKLVKGESSWTVYANGLEKGQMVLTNLKDDFFVQLGDATVYISELLGLPIEANA